MLRAFLIGTSLLVIASPSFAEIRYVRAGDSLQAAIDAARPGDEIRLAAGATFTGNFVLPVFDGDAVVTLRTDLPDSSLPAANHRVTGSPGSSPRRPRRRCGRRPARTTGG